MTIGVSPFAAAMEQAIADLQGTTEAGHAPAAEGTETPGETVQVEAAGTDDSASGTTEVAAGETTAVVEDPSPTTPTPPVAVEDPTQTPTSKEEQRVWNLRHRGKEVRISEESEVVELAQKGFDYQVKTQELAAQERERASAWEKKETALRQFLGNKEMVRSYLEDLENLEQGGPDPNQPLTAAQAQTMVNQRVEQALEKEREERAKQAYQYQVSTLTSQYRTEVDRAVSVALAAHPVLSQFVDGVEVLLLADVAPQVAAKIQSDPDTPVDLAEVTQLIAAAAAKRAEKLKALEVNAQKVAAVKAAEMKRSSPAPAGGSPAKQVPAPVKAFKLGDKGLVNAAIADLQKGRGI